MGFRYFITGSFRSFGIVFSGNNTVVRIYKTTVLWYDNGRSRVIHMEKLRKLREKLNDYAAGGLAVAFSGGTDSSLLLKLACETGYPVQAVMLRSQLMPLRDPEIAARVAEECGAALTVLDVDLTGVPQVMGNDRKRCYYCKRELFRTIKRWCEKQGISDVVDGTNTDDLNVYRPGLQALRELGIHSPLADCGFTKADVRALAESLGLSVAARPASPCMATRIPYDTALDFDVLRRLERGESLLQSMGFSVCRLRLHDQVLRIEIPAANLPALLEHREQIVFGMKELGFSYITLDLEGFRSGSMDL